MTDLLSSKQIAYLSNNLHIVGDFLCSQRITIRVTCYMNGAPISACMPVTEIKICNTTHVLIDGHLPEPWQIKCEQRDIVNYLSANRISV